MPAPAEAYHPAPAPISVPTFGQEIIEPNIAELEIPEPMAARQQPAPPVPREWTCLNHYVILYG